MFGDKSGFDFSYSLLLQTFIGRFRRIMDSSQNAYNEDTSALVARLDEMERGLFQTGQKGLNDFQCWEKGQASQITASSLVQNYKKRTFTDMESWRPEEYRIAPRRLIPVCPWQEPGWPYQGPQSYLSSHGLFPAAVTGVVSSGWERTCWRMSAAL